MHISSINLLIRCAVQTFLWNTLLISISACRETPASWNEKQEQENAQAFVTNLNEISMSKQWSKFSLLLDPDPHCQSEHCLIVALTRGTDCETKKHGRIVFDPTTVKLYHHGDGFAVSATLSPPGPPCKFRQDVYRENGTGRHYIKIVTAIIP